LELVTSTLLEGKYLCFEVCLSMGTAASLSEYHVDALAQVRYRREIAAIFVEVIYTY
jgi:hypothetical protein